LTRGACSNTVAGRARDGSSQMPQPRAINVARRIGVLAIQGDFEAHASALGKLGCEAVEVRRPAHLEGLEGLVIPGGESTTICKGIDAYELAEPIRRFANSGLPVLGTCAGLIVLDRSHLGLMDISARRNAFGRQVKSFEADVSVQGLDGGPLRAVFIRAPWIESCGDAVEVLAEIDGHPIVARERNLLVSAFHPELTDDPRLHQLFLGRGGDALPLETKAGSAAGSRREA
jgi:5'-phosphate synthase pdxT subunit